MVQIESSQVIELMYCSYHDAFMSSLAHHFELGLIKPQGIQ